MEDLINIGVTVVEVRELGTWKLPVLGKEDLYAVIKVSAKEDKTKAIHTRKNRARWDETFHYVIEPKDSIILSVFGQRFFGQELFGKLSVPAGIIFEEGPIEGWYPITRGGKNGGEIFIRIHYLPSPESLVYA